MLCLCLCLCLGFGPGPGWYSLSMSLIAGIEEWDEKSKVQIERVYLDHSTSDSFFTDLIELLGSEETEVGVTWLMKRYLEEGSREISGAVADVIFGFAKDLTRWESKLHLLQSLDYLPITAGSADTVLEFVRSCAQDDAKFVRAWAYSGFIELASRFPKYEQEADDVVARAMEVETAGSVLARIRRKLAE